MNIGKSFNNFTRKIGKAMDYNKLRQLGGSVVKAAASGLHDAANIGGQISGVLGKVRQVADGLRGVPLIGGIASVVGGGLAQAKSVLDLGRGGVQGLEKAVKHVANVGNTVDSHQKLIANGWKSGDTTSIVGAAKDIANVASQNPFLTK